MVTGIYVKGFQYGGIKNVSISNFDIGMHIVDSSFGNFDDIEIQGCRKGVVLDNGDNNKFNNFNYNYTQYNSNRMKLLAYLIKKQMYGYETE